ncbi:MAG TPA: ethanolamine ammonia-lyase subunit EutC [Enterovirga sp.]
MIDPWAHVRRLTPARVALGRTGSALLTAEVLRFALAHAQARDAVHIPLDLDRLEPAIRAAGLETLRVQSAAVDRVTYLARPDLGRRLAEPARALLRNGRRLQPDLAIVVADGLSSPAAVAHAAPLLAGLAPRLEKSGLTTGPIVIATQARVALGDEVGVLLGARAVLVLVGERPGLSSPDSLGAYLTFAPRVGRNDADRNCVSNIRPAGLSYDLAVFKLAWLIDQAFKRQLTGVALKDDSGTLLLDGDVVSRKAQAPPS